MPCGCANNKNLDEKDLYNKNLNVNNKNLNLDTMKNMPIEEITRLYQQGYRIGNSGINQSDNIPNQITSLASHPTIIDAGGSYNSSTGNTTALVLFTNSSAGYLNTVIYDTATGTWRAQSQQCQPIRLGLGFINTFIFSGAFNLIDVFMHYCSSGESCTPPDCTGQLYVSSNLNYNAVEAYNSASPPVPNMTLTPGNGQIKVDWTPPSTSAYIFAYAVICQVGSTTGTTVDQGFVSNTTRSYTFTGLTNNQSYAITMYALTRSNVYGSIVTQNATPVPPPPVLTTITVTPNPATVNINATQVFTAKAIDQNGNPMSGVSLAWVSSNTNLATVSPASGTTDSSGNTTTTLTAKSTIGTLTLSASGSGKTGTAQVSITSPSQILNSIAISPTNPTVIPGQSVQFVPTCRDTSNIIMTCPTLTWNNTNNAVGTIGATGLFTAIAVGTTSVTATGGGKTSNIATVTVSTTPPPTAGGGAGMAIALIGALGFAYLILKPKPKV